MKDRSLARAVGLTRGDQKSTCVSCHTADTASVSPFDFTKAIQLVRHQKRAVTP